MSKLKKISSWVVGIAIGLPIAIIVLRFMLYFILGASCIFFYTFSWAVGNVEEDSYQYSFPIEAMKDNVTYVQGRYDTDSELKYYFVRDYGNTSHTGWVDAYESSIVEDGKSEVLVFADEPKIGGEIWHKTIDFVWDGQYPLNKSYEFHIPSGSIEKDFDVDLE